MYFWARWSILKRSCWSEAAHFLWLFVWDLCWQGNGTVHKAKYSTQSVTNQPRCAGRYQQRRINAATQLHKRLNVYLWRNSLAEIWSISGGFKWCNNDAEGQAWPLTQNSREEIRLHKSLTTRTTALGNIFNTTLISFSTTKRSQLLLEKHKL